MAQAAQSLDVLSNDANIKILSNVLKTNVSACIPIGSRFLPQIARIFLDMLGLYKAVSGIISETVSSKGSYSFTPILHYFRPVCFPHPPPQVLSLPKRPKSDSCGR